MFARDVQINDTAYRRLDPEYYAWLRSRMNLAKMAADAGKLGRDEFDELRRRFNAVHEWAMQHLGALPLTEAVRGLDSRDYRPPAAEQDRPLASHGGTESSATATFNATTLVDAIAEKALALGWSRERLYAIGNGTFDPQRGLVRYLKVGGRIGEVTAQSIEIIHPLPSEVRHRFYNPDVDQPWIIRVAEQKK